MKTPDELRADLEAKTKEYNDVSDRLDEIEDEIEDLEHERWGLRKERSRLEKEVKELEETVAYAENCDDEEFIAMMQRPEAARNPNQLHLLEVEAA